MSSPRRCRYHFRLGLLLLLALAACTDARMATDPLASSGAVAKDAAGDDAELTVMTRNMYFGASLDPIIAEQNPYQVPVQAWNAWLRVESTRPADRVRAIAQEIAEANPDVIGLQEVALWRAQYPADNYPGVASTRADSVVYDFLALLVDDLNTLGVSYEVASVVTSFDIEALTYPASFNLDSAVDRRLTDRNVILVRRGLRYSNVDSSKFSTSLPLTIAGSPLAIQRAWQRLDVTVAGRTITFANTHLEQEQFAFAQEPQAAELRDALRSAVNPVIITGDFNSAADGHNTATYRQMLSDGYVDAWASPRPGFSCCQQELLDNERSTASERIDFVFTRRLNGTAQARLVGFAPSTRMSLGVWASDHAGVVATLALR